MHLSPNENNNVTLSKFESMLKTNHVLFFDAEEFEAIINYYMDSGKTSLAKKAIHLALEQHPTSISLKLYKVEMLIFEDKLDMAQDLLNELESIEASNEEIYIQKANIYSRKENHSKAIELLEIALKLTDDEADVRNLIGMEYLFVEDYDKARHQFLKCLEIDPYDYASLHNVIYCFENTEKHQEAIVFLNDYLNTNPYCEIAWHQVGMQYMALKQYKKALAAFDFAIISDDTFVGAYIEKGLALEKLKRYQEAIENYILTLNLDDPTSFALMRIGKCYDKLGNEEQALEFYLKCVNEDPMLDKAWLALTDFHIKKRNLSKALYYINKAIDIDTENVLYWKRYGKINHYLHFYEEAEIGYRRAIELGNYELKTWLNRSEVLLQIGEFEAATENALQALEFYPESSEIQYHLAGLYYINQEVVKGKFHLVNALKANPENLIILEVLFPSVYKLKQVQQLCKYYTKEQ